MVSESPSGGGGKEKVKDPTKSDSQAKKKKTNRMKKSTKKTNKNKATKTTRERDKIQHFRVENILDHKLDRRKGSSCEYLVKWAGYAEEENSWISANDFDDVNINKKYWNERRKNSRNRS